MYVDFMNICIKLNLKKKQNNIQKDFNYVLNLWLKHLDFKKFYNDQIIHQNLIIKWIY